MLLVPADPLWPRRPDEHFAPEAAAARDAGLEVALVDHGALAGGGDVERAVATVAGSGTGVYRGWMLRSEQYSSFATALAARGVTLRTSSEQFKQAHELPGWYSSLAAVTPLSAWTIGYDRAGFDRVRVELGAGPAVLRDYVKSMKHYWREAAFIPDLADGVAAWQVASRFRQLREDDFVGGFVLRRFEQFTSAEVRTWWVNGECGLIGAHPDTPNELPDSDVDITSVAPVVAAMGLPFVTVDLARRGDGVWRVVELGDGQVSDRPDSLAPHRLIAALSVIV
jgi:ATP-grasp domain, R2K clade family 3